MLIDKDYPNVVKIMCAVRETEPLVFNPSQDPVYIAGRQEADKLIKKLELMLFDSSNNFQKKELFHRTIVSLENAFCDMSAEESSYGFCEGFLFGINLREELLK